MQNSKSHILFFVVCLLLRLNVPAQQNNLRPRLVRTHGVTRLLLVKIRF